MSSASAARASNPAGGALQSWLLPAILALAIAAAYSNSFEGEFIFDDGRSIPRNSSIRSLWPLRNVLFPNGSEQSTTRARPVLNLTLALNYAWGELDVTGYHVFNLLVHIATALALYGVVRRTLLLPRWPGSVTGRATQLSFVCALLWALHPLQTESVTYIIQRAESMAGLFYLVTLYCSIRGYGSGFPAAWYCLSVAACCLGVGTKEVLATAPLMVLLYDRTFLFSSLKDMFLARRWFYAALAGTWILMLALMASGEGRGGTVGFGLGVTPLDYLATQCWAVPHYLRLAVVPYPLVLDYGSELITEPAEVVPGLIVLVALTGGTLVAFRFYPWIGFLGSCFFLILGPSSSVVPIVTQTIAEHRMYLPLASVIVLMVLAADCFYQRYLSRYRALPAVIVVLLAVLLGGMTYRRNIDYRTEQSIFADTVAKRPGNFRFHMAMADLLLRQGNEEAALRELEIAMQLGSQSSADYYNLGTLLLIYKRPKDAIKQFDAALKHSPDDTATWNNRGIAWQDQGRHDLAIQDFNAALSRNPQLAIAYKSRAVSYQALGQNAEAEADRRRFLELGGKQQPQPSNSH